MKNWALSLKSKSLTFKEKLTQYIENTEENGKDIYIYIVVTRI